MKLIALLIGLIVERLATQLFHLRELRWLDRLIDFGFRQVDRYANWPPLILVLLLTFVLVLPVLLVVLSLGDTFHGFLYLIFAVVVLFFSLGPRDIAGEVDEHCAALKSEDAERIRTTAKALLEKDIPADPVERSHAVEQAVCVQGNNRLFAVIFWFILLGPLGAWTYRVTDLIRRRAVFKAARDDSGAGAASLVVGAAEDLHGWLAWIPARLTAVGYALAGNFDAALGAWRTPMPRGTEELHARSEHLLARVGAGALALHPVEDETITDRSMRGATAARKLVLRSLLIWAAAVAAMTLYGWSR
ncbi:MAG: regulatory signaling modulator protein AmpE [Woeseia sp.]